MLLLSCLWSQMCLGVVLVLMLVVRGGLTDANSAETGEKWQRWTIHPWAFVPALIRPDVVLQLLLDAEWTLYSREGEDMRGRKEGGRKGWGCWRREWDWFSDNSRTEAALMEVLRHREGAGGTSLVQGRVKGREGKNDRLLRRCI